MQETRKKSPIRTRTEDFLYQIVGIRNLIAAPLRALAGILNGNAHISQYTADTVCLSEVLLLLGCGALRDQLLDLLWVSSMNRSCAAVRNALVAS